MIDIVLRKQRAPVVHLHYTNNILIGGVFHEHSARKSAHDAPCLPPRSSWYVLALFNRPLRRLIVFPTSNGGLMFIVYFSLLRLRPNFNLYGSLCCYWHYGSRSLGASSGRKYHKIFERRRRSCVPEAVPAASLLRTASRSHKAYEKFCRACFRQQSAAATHTGHPHSWTGAAMYTSRGCTAATWAPRSAWGMAAETSWGRRWETGTARVAVSMESARVRPSLPWLRRRPPHRTR